MLRNFVESLSSLFSNPEAQNIVREKRNRERVIANETGYEHIGTSKLKNLILLEKDPNKVIQEAQKHTIKGELKVDELKKMILMVPIEMLIGKGKVFEFTVDNPFMRRLFFEELRSRVGVLTSAYLGTPSTHNHNFMSMVGSLGRLNTKRIGCDPILENLIIQEFLLTQITYEGPESWLIDAIAQSFFKMPYPVSQNDYQLVQKSIAERREKITHEPVMKNNDDLQQDEFEAFVQSRRLV